MTTVTPPDPESAAVPQPTALVRAGQSYVDRPLYRALTDIAAQIAGFSLETFGGIAGASVAVPVAIKSADAALAEGVGALRARQARHRADVLNCEVSESGAEVRAEVLLDPTFLHAYEATLRAALRTYRDDKIRLFGRLLGSAARGEAITDLDEYEELLGVLDEMSTREIQVLAILDPYQRTGDLHESYWKEFAGRVVAEAKVPHDELEAFMTRLTRTGLYTSSVGTWGGSATMGNLTPRWDRLRDLIADSEGNVMEPSPPT